MIVNMPPEMKMQRVTLFDTNSGQSADTTLAVYRLEDGSFAVGADDIGAEGESVGTYAVVASLNKPNEVFIIHPFEYTETLGDRKICQLMPTDVTVEQITTLYKDL